MFSTVVVFMVKKSVEMDTFNKLIQSSTPTLVDFFATWCGPCRMMHPVLDELKGMVGERATIVKVDVDLHNNRNLTARYGIQAVPTLVLFKNGAEVWRHSGTMDACSLQTVIERA